MARPWKPKLKILGDCWLYQTHLQAKSTNIRSTIIQSTHSHSIKVKYHLSFSLKLAIIVSSCRTILITIRKWLIRSWECSRKIVCQGHFTKRYVKANFLFPFWEQWTAWNGCGTQLHVKFFIKVINLPERQFGIGKLELIFQRWIKFAILEKINGS